MNLNIQPFYFRSQVQRYVLFLIGRVGSTYLMQLMNSHPSILALSEELNDLQEKGAAAQLEWTQHFFTPPLITRHQVIGFNVKLYHVVDPAAFSQLMVENNCKVIHLQRRNRIKGTVSYFMGKKLSESTGMWGLFDEQNRPTSIQIDPDEFDAMLQRREQIQGELDKYIESINLPKLMIYYEDLQFNRDLVLQQLFSFFNVKTYPVQANTLKIASDDLRKVIINFDQLRSKYEGTLYAPMFDEVLGANTAS